MKLARQSLALTATLLFIANDGLAGEQGVKEFVVDRRKQVIEVPVKPEGMTLFHFDTAVKHVFSSDPYAQKYSVEILEDLKAGHIKHPPMLLKVGKGLSSAENNNLIVITDHYTLSIRLRVTGKSDPNDVHLDLVGIKWRSPSAVSVQQHPSARQVTSSDSTERAARGLLDQSAIQTLANTTRSSSYVVRVSHLHWQDQRDAFIFFELEHDGRAPGSTPLVSLTIGNEGRSVADKTYWRVAKAEQAAGSSGRALGVLFVPGADKLRGRKLTLHVRDPRSETQIDVEGIEW